jgi:hypothetical protein
MIYITELSDLVEICWELASRGAKFKAYEYDGGWRIEILGV